jgi:hypothetical protein
VKSSARTTGRLGGATLLLISAAFLAWGYWPAARVVRTQSVASDPALAGTVTPRLQTTLISPTRIRLGDSALLQLTVGPETAAEGGDSELTDRYLAHARLDLPRLHVQPAGLISEPMPVGGAASYFWTVRASSVGKHDGTAWLYISRAPSGIDQRAPVPIAAQRVRLEVVSLFGLGGAASRTLGTIGGLISVPVFIGLVSRRPSGRDRR